MSDEKVLDTEIAAYDNKFQQWTRSQLSVKHKRTEFELNNKNVALPPEVEEFEVKYVCMYVIIIVRV